MEIKAEAILPTSFGDFIMSAYSEKVDDYSPHLVLTHKDLDPSKPVTIRIHSECITGDIFQSERCDCGEQLHYAMDILNKEKGMLIYLRQEGRGIGIIQKLKAYNLQDQGLDTFAANVHLGFEPDERDYSIVEEILLSKGISQIYLLTNNPDKMSIFDDSQIQLLQRMPIVITPKNKNEKYISDKIILAGHLK